MLEFLALLVSLALNLLVLVSVGGTLFIFIVWLISLYNYWIDPRR